MTLDGYRAMIRSLGLTPYRPSVNRHTIHSDGKGDFVRVPDPEYLSPEERAEFINLLKAQLKIDLY